MADIMNTLCGWTGTDGGQIVVGASVLVLGLTHFGWASGFADWSVGGISVGTVAGTVGVIVGGCTLWNALV